MPHSNRFLAIIAGLTLAVSLTGCRSGKSASQGLPAQVTPGTTAPGNVNTPVDTQTPQLRVQALTAAEGDWTDVKMTVRLDLTAPKRFGASGRAEMKRGEWIFLSARMLGFEVAYVWIDTDSIHVVDKFHKRYVSEGIGRLMAGANVTLTNVQDLLIGRIFRAGSRQRPSVSDFDIDQSDSGLMLLPKESPAGFDYGFILSNDANTLAATAIAVGERYAANVSYADYAPTPAGLWPEAVAIDVVKGKNLGATIEWRTSSASWNQGLDRRWSLPKGYTRIDSSSLLKLISSF